MPRVTIKISNEPDMPSVEHLVAELFPRLLMASDFALVASQSRHQERMLFEDSLPLAKGMYNLFVSIRGQWRGNLDKLVALKSRVVETEVSHHHLLWQMQGALFGKEGAGKYLCAVPLRCFEIIIWLHPEDHNKQAKLGKCCFFYQVAVQESSTATIFTMCNHWLDWNQ